MKHVFDGLISRWGAAAERTSELGRGVSLDRNLQNWKGKKTKTEDAEDQKTVGQLWPMHHGNTRRNEKSKEREKYLKQCWLFPQINIRHQTTAPGSSENSKKEKKKNKTPQHLFLEVSFSNYRKSKLKGKKSRKKPEGEKNIPYLDSNKDKNYIWLPRNYANKKEVDCIEWQKKQNIECAERKKDPSA